MTTQQRILSLVQLGQFLNTNDTSIDNVLKTIQYQNGWFTPEQTRFCLQQWASAFTEENLSTWIEKYTVAEKRKKIGLVLAGNIPLVGLHDVLCVLLSGHSAHIKLSSQDPTLLPFLLNKLIEIAPEFGQQIIFTERLKDIDAVIATGSNNSARYFDYYFGKYPHIIRKNRNSVALLTGNESAEELSALGEDIFRYYGLGCRNVSKLYVPRNYDFVPFFEAIESYKTVLDNHKYNNNYDYNRTLLLLNNTTHLDNRFLMVVENEALASPMATLHFEYYDFISEAEAKIAAAQNNIQCTVGLLPTYIPFGKTQQPALTDYADGIDTLHFLSTLH